MLAGWKGGELGGGRHVECSRSCPIGGWMVRSVYNSVHLTQGKYVGMARIPMELPAVSVFSLLFFRNFKKMEGKGR